MTNPMPNPRPWQASSLPDLGGKHLRSLVRELAPSMPEAVAEYGQLLQLAVSLAGHLVRTWAPEAQGGLEGVQRHQRRQMLDLGSHDDADRSASWLPYLVASHLIQGHSGLTVQGGQRMNALVAAGAVLASSTSVSGRAECDPATPGCVVPRRPVGDLGDPSAASLVHLARRLVQQQGQDAGCSAGVTFNPTAIGGSSSVEGGATAPGRRGGGGREAAPGRGRRGGGAAPSKKLEGGGWWEIPGRKLGWEGGGTPGRH